MSYIEDFGNDLKRKFEAMSSARFKEILGVDPEVLKSDHRMIRSLLVSRLPKVRAEAIRFLVCMVNSEFAVEEILRKFAVDDQDGEVRFTAVAALGSTAWGDHKLFESAVTRQLLLKIIMDDGESKTLRVAAYRSVIDWDKFSELMEKNKGKPTSFEDIDWVYLSSLNTSNQ